MKMCHWKQILTACVSVAAFQMGASLALAQGQDLCGTLPRSFTTGSNKVFATTAASTFTAGDPRNCQNRNQLDTWYSFLATGTGQVSIQRTSGATLGLSAWTDCPGIGTQLACTGTVSGSTVLRFNVVNGTTYLVRATSYASASDPEGPATFGSLTGTVTFNPLPANDTCATAQLIMGTTTVSGVNDVAALADAPFPSCGTGTSTTQRDVWFEYVATRTGVVIISGVTGTLAAFTGCAGSEIKCGSIASFVMPIVNGQHYWIRSSRVSSASSSTYNLSFTEFDPAPNDSCTTAGTSQLIVGSNSYTAQGTIDDDAFEGTGVPCNPQSTQSTWHTFLPPSNGIAVFTLDSSSRSMAAYASCGGACIGCGPGTGGPNTSMRVTVTKDVPIIVRIDHGSPSTGGTITVAIVTAADNDLCSNATPLTPSVTRTVSFADAGGFETLTCESLLPFASWSDVWYSYTAPSNGVGMVHTCGSVPTVSTSLAVYTSCGGSPIECNLFRPEPANFVPLCGDTSSMVMFAATAGTTYYIRLASVSGFCCNSQITLEFTPGNDPVNLPATAQVLSGNGLLDTITGTITDSTEVHIYKIQICNEADFFATTLNAQTTGNTALYLFNASGHGVTFNDDDNANSQKSSISSSNVTSNGIYYLAVTSGRPLGDILAGTWWSGPGRMPASNGSLIWNPKPVTAERAPDGVGAAGAITGWVGFGHVLTPFNFEVSLSGACLITACVADHNHSGTVTVQDIFSFLSAWFAGNTSADANTSGTVTVQDIFFFLSRWFAGC